MLDKILSFLETTFSLLGALSYRFWLFVLGVENDAKMEKGTLLNWHSNLICVWFHVKTVEFYITYINLIGNLVKVTYVSENGKWRIKESTSVDTIEGLSKMVLVKNIVVDDFSVTEEEFNKLYSIAEDTIEKSDLKCMLAAAVSARAPSCSIIKSKYFPIWKKGFCHYFILP